MLRLLFGVDENDPEFEKAFRQQITFIVDAKIFDHSKFKKLDFGDALIIAVADNDVINDKRTECLATQNALKGMGLYSDRLNGTPGEETTIALATFKRNYHIDENAEIVIYPGESKQVKFKNVEDFLTQYKREDDDCQSSASLCVNTEGEASFSAECKDLTVEFSTSGEITLTTSYEEKTYSISLNDVKDAVKNGCITSGTGNLDYKGFLQIIRCFQKNYKGATSDCEQGFTICVNRKTGVSIEISCNDDKYSITTSGQFSMSAKNGRGVSVQF
ncbi:hypothetical protein [Chitinophaga sp. LS1]|uniref:hypothetical protein n=1 Tax=Chitinophaga sp. LS1 TaxID=3051176 RepID=UPI002AAB039A|nr:hypothetical protein [Chitinophaga sp. LS1]WPV67504.1 hypothetical protein QQL36_02035 [Chitinophaga sp. LS1]